MIEKKWFDIWWVVPGSRDWKLNHDIEQSRGVRSEPRLPYPDTCKLDNPWYPKLQTPTATKLSVWHTVWHKLLSVNKRDYRNGPKYVDPSIVGSE